MVRQTLIVSAEVIAQEVSGETVLLDLKSEQYFSLDAVGTRIWQLVNEGAVLDEIKRTLLKEYDVNEAQIDRDLNVLIEELVREGLLSVADDGE